MWLESVDAVCPACGEDASVRERVRNIKGWIGVQRYFDKSHFGIDLIRNGRVIEELDKSLFDWIDPETNQSELEYPVDTIHWGGRIVGELEIDFVRVSHQKDAFDKLDPQWREVSELVRGTSPMRPQVARRRGYAVNNSTLARLYAGYRAGKETGFGDLVPGNERGQGRNDSMILEWVQRFHDGDPDFQTDKKWYELVELAERVKRGKSQGSEEAAGDLPIPDPDGTEDAEDVDGPENGDAPDPPQPVQANLFETDTELTRTYKLEQLPGAPSMIVNAKRAQKGLAGRPIIFDTSASGGVEFQYDLGHPFFEESLAIPLDCLISDLAHRFLLLSGQTQRDFPLATIERNIREVYFPETLTSVAEAAEEAKGILDDLRQFLDEHLHEVAPIASSVMDEHTLGLVRKGVLESTLGGEQDVQRAIEAGEFIRYVGTDFLISTPSVWPRLIMDGGFVSVPYEDVSDFYRADSIAMVSDGLRDAAWIVSDSGGGAISKDQRWRFRFTRSLSSIRLLGSWRG